MSTQITPERAKRFVSEPGDYVIEIPAGELGAELRGVREARGLTQTDVAERLDTAQTQVSRLEHSSNPTATRLRDYLTALGAANADVVVTFPDGARVVLPLL